MPPLAGNICLNQALIAFDFIKEIQQQPSHKT